jgi:DNA (cytosine-5)-methyltransferase 1
MRTRYKLVSLFSGAGGLDLGFELTGDYRILLANDVKEFMVRTYEANFKVSGSEYPRIVQGDVAELRFEGLEADVVIGGPPCQDFSILRASTAERGGITVRRGRLYSYFVKALAILKPKAFLFENVPGLVTANEGAAYKTILEDLANLNLRWDEVQKSLGEVGNCKVPSYHIIFAGVVNAAHFGVPQNRRRLIIVGLRSDFAKRGFEPHLIFRKTLEEGKSIFRRAPLTPIEVFEGRPLPELQDLYERIMEEYDGIWLDVGSARAWGWKKEVWDKLTFDVVRDYMAIHRLKDADLGRAIEMHQQVLAELGYLGTSVSSLKLADGSCLHPTEPPEIIEKVRMIPPGENFAFVVGTRWELRKKGVSQIYRRLHPLRPSYTVVGYGGGGMAMYHYERSRSALSSREKARLQTFPDSFIFVGSYSNMKAEIGEAVPPLLAKRLARALSAVLKTLES